MKLAKKIRGGKNSSVSARKQRLARYSADLHNLQKFMHVNLSKTLREKYGRRSLLVKKGDTVKVSRGQYKGKEGKVELVSLKRGFVNVAGCELIKKDGGKNPRAIKPSNLQIQTLDLSDAKRKAKLESKKGAKAKAEVKK